MLDAGRCKRNQATASAQTRAFRKSSDNQGPLDSRLMLDRDQFQSSLSVRGNADTDIAPDVSYFLSILPEIEHIVCMTRSRLRSAGSAGELGVAAEVGLPTLEKPSSPEKKSARSTTTSSSFGVALMRSMMKELQCLQSAMCCEAPTSACFRAHPSARSPFHSWTEPPSESSRFQTR